MSINVDIKEKYLNHCQFLFSLLSKEEELLCSYAGEETDFIRFNALKVRQSTTVHQGMMTLELQVGKKRIKYSYEFTASDDLNQTRGEKALVFCRSQIKSMAADPFIIPMKNNGTSFTSSLEKLPAVDDVINVICEDREGVDLAGIWCQGIIRRGSCNSLGQEHWFESSSFYFDYSLYFGKERAVKGSYSGKVFAVASLEKAITESIRELEIMKSEKKEIKPGRYRCYFSPRAVNELLSMRCWFSMSKYKAGSSCAKDYIEGDKMFSPLFSVSEDFSLGLTTTFNHSGEVAPDKIDIVSAGALKQLMVSSATAKEFDVQTNFAEQHEYPRSLVMSCGDLNEDDILQTLGTGLYISDLHYLNWSDVVGGRITGMTRFGCFWVENGRVIGPIKDMRFDETLGHIFGEGLKQVTTEALTIIDTESYERRSLGGTKVPGMIVDDFTFSL